MKRLLTLFYVFVLMLFILGPGLALAGPTGMPSGVKVGNYPQGGTDTRVTLTGTAATYNPILGAAQLLNGDCFTRPLTITSTTLPYLQAWNGRPAVSIAAAASAVSMCASIIVPRNYGSAGAFVAVVRIDVSDAALRLRGDIRTEALNSLTNTTFTQGTGVAVPDAAMSQDYEVVLTNAQTFTAGSTAMCSIFKSAGSTAIISVLYVEFRYKPDYVMP